MVYQLFFSTKVPFLTPLKSVYGRCLGRQGVMEWRVDFPKVMGGGRGSFLKLHKNSISFPYQKNVGRALK